MPDPLNPLHSAQSPTNGGVHVVHAFTYADAAAREGAAGLTDTDVGKAALQTDTATLWALADADPVTWVPLQPYAAGVTVGDGNLAQWDGAGLLTDSGIASTTVLVDADTATAPTPFKIPLADSLGNIDPGWVQSATTTQQGVVELATAGEVAAGTNADLAISPAALAGSTVQVTPSAHAPTHEPGGSDPISLATTTQAGLVELATAGEVAAGTNADLAITPAALAGSTVQVTPSAHAPTHQHGGSDEVGTGTPAPYAIPKAGPGSTLDTWVSLATTTQAGRVELATAGEVAAGTNDSLAITPASLAGSTVQVTPSAHADTHEPGGSDPIQLATITQAGLVELATSSEVAGGTRDDLAISPAALAGSTVQVTPSAHATRHQHGGDDEVATGTPGAYAIPKANALAKLDSWISLATTTVAGLVELATSDEVAGGTRDDLAATPASLAGQTFTPAPHAATHEPGGSDPIQLATTTQAGLVELATAGEVAAGTNDSLAISPAALAGSTVQVAPSAHATRHQHGGDDEVATVTPGGFAIPKANAGGYLTSWVEPASTTRQGIVELATSGEVAAGTNDSLAITPAALAGSTVQVTPSAHADTHEPGGSDPIDLATTTQAGLVELATTAEVSGGTRSDLAVTPAALAATTLTMTPSAHASSHQHGGADEVASLTAGAFLIPKASSLGKLDSWISVATTTVQGIVELATTAEVAAQTRTDLAVTPASLAGLTLTDQLVRTSATDTQESYLVDKAVATSPLAVNEEAGTVGKRLRWTVGAATTLAAGVVELATQAEVDTGTDTERAVTPATLSGSVLAGGGDYGRYGDGSDGDVTLTSDTTLTRDMYYNNLVTSTYKLHGAGYRIYAKVSVTVSSGGMICNEGYNASGKTGGAGAEGSVLGNGVDGGSEALPGSSITSAVGGDGGQGGAGGTGPSAGAVGGTVTGPATNVGGFRATPVARLGILIGGGGAAGKVLQINGGAGGGGGRGQGGGTAADGGGGGGGGGWLVLSSPLITNNGSINADGGDGADAVDVSGGNGGGGGGGGGGVCVVDCATFTGNTPTADGGAGGAGVNSGTAGTAGSAGVAMLFANNGA